MRNLVCQGVLVLLFGLVARDVAAQPFSPVVLSISDLQTDGMTGSFVVKASPDQAFVPGLFGLNFQFTEFSSSLSGGLEFSFTSLLSGMADAGQPFTTPAGTLNADDIVQFVAFGPTTLPSEGADVMRLDFSVPGGFDPAVEGFRVDIVPANPADPINSITFFGDNSNAVTLASLDIGMPGDVVVMFDACDVNRDSICDAADIDRLSMALRDGEMDAAYDLNGDGQFSAADRGFWIRDLMRTYSGDSNLDGEFNTSDLIAVLREGQFEDAVPGNSTWATGDWNGNGDFETGDLIAAFADGGFESGPRAAVAAVAAVPEPSSAVLCLLALPTLLAGVRRR